MDDDFRWHKVVGRLLGGGLGGLACGALLAGLLSVAIAGVIEACDKSQVGLMNSLVFLCSAGVAAPGSVLGGALGAVWRRPRLGLLAGSCGGVLALVYLTVLTWLSDDSWFAGALVLWGGVIPGTMTAGAYAGWATEKYRT